MIRVYIVDEHTSVRSALADRLGRAANIHVVGHTGLPQQVITDISQETPEVVLMEVKRSDGMGLELLRQVASIDLPPVVIVLTSYGSQWEHDAALRAGAWSYLLKDIDSEELIRQIEVACAGGG
jgi:DNA-binding NarL/FixJ family response regulator